jgi:hypothetical protein
MKINYELLERFGNGKLDEPMRTPEFMRLFNISHDEWQVADENINEYGNIDKTFNFILIKDGEELEDEILTIEIDENELITHLYY